MDVEWRRWTSWWGPTVPEVPSWDTLIKDRGVSVYVRISRETEEWDCGILLSAAYGLEAQYGARGETREVVLRRLVDEIDDAELCALVEGLPWPGSEET